MRKEIKELWVNALRSGEYKQHTGSLKDPDTNSFCCLGVLCDLHRKRRKTATWKFNSSYGSTDYMNNSGALPAKVIKWAGLDKDVESGKILAPASVYIVKNNESLIRKNDYGGTFAQIADIIEENL